MRRTVPFALVFSAAMSLNLAARAQAPVTKAVAPIPIDSSPLGRYIPQTEQTWYYEFAGLDTQREAWAKTNAYALLVDTKLGGMLEELGAQVFTKYSSSIPNNKLSGPEAIALYKHMMKYGFVASIGGRRSAKSPDHVALVIRGAARKDARPLFGKSIASMTPAGSQSKADKKNGRAVVLVTTPTKATAMWWAENNDLVFGFAQGQFDSAAAIMAAIDKKVPTMADSPLRAELFAASDGFVPISVAHVDLPDELGKGLPPAVGFAGFKKIDYRWGLQDNALMSITRISAPEPRAGLLALFDQPTFSSSDLPPLPGNLTGFTALSMSPAQVWTTGTSIIAAVNPNGADRIAAIEALVKERTRLKLKEEILSHLGPKFAFYIAPNTGGSVISNLFTIPKMVLIAEVDDSVAFGRALDQVMIVVNGAIRDTMEQAKESAIAAAGANDPEAKTKAGSPSKKATAKRSGPADPSIPNFRLAAGAGKSYLLDLPQGSLPIALPGFKPTIQLGAKHFVIATSPDVARQALEVKPANQFKPADAMATAFSKVPKNLVFLTVNDPSAYLPAALVSLPTSVPALITQFDAILSGKAAPGLAGMMAGAPGGTPPGAPGGGDNEQMAILLGGRPGGSGSGAGGPLGQSGRPPGGPRSGGSGAGGAAPNAEGNAATAASGVIAVDPALIPTVSDIAGKIFPATTSVSVDKTGMTIITRQSFPDIVTSSASTGVMVGLLAPALQSARAAARRAAGLPEPDAGAVPATANPPGGPATLTPGGAGGSRPPGTPGGRGRPGGGGLQEP